MEKAETVLEAERPSKALREGSFEDALSYWLPPSGMRREYCDARFGQIHYRAVRPPKATGVPLVFLHQSPSSGRVFEGLLARMGKDRLCLAPDTPGFGDSDAPAEPPAIADYAAAIGDFLDSLGVGTVDLLGDHTGAKVAVELALQRPNQIRRMVFNACPVYPPQLMAKMRAHLDDEKSNEVSEDGSHLIARWSAVLGWYKDGTPLDLFDRDFAETLRAGPLAWYGHNAAFAVNHADNLPNIPHPVLVLCPDDGLAEATKAAAPHLRNGKILDLPEWGMGAVSLHTSEMATILRDFLDAAADDAHGQIAPKEAPPLPHELRPNIRRSFVDTSIGQLHVRGVGTSKPGVPALFCLHMSPVSGRNFEPLMRELGTSRAVFAADIPGFGESVKLPAEQTIEELAGVLAEVMEALDGVGIPLDILGDHTGAMIALQLAADRPDLVRRVALNTVPFYSEEEKKERLQHAVPVRPSPDGSHLVTRRALMERLSGPGVSTAMIERNFVEALRGGPLGHLGHRAVFKHDLHSVLPRVLQDVLVFRPRDGLEDQTVRALPLIRNARMVDLPDCRYGFMEVRAPEIAGMLRDFFDS